MKLIILYLPYLLLSILSIRFQSILVSLCLLLIDKTCHTLQFRVTLIKDKRTSKAGNFDTVNIFAKQDDPVKLRFQYD